MSERKEPSKRPEGTRKPTPTTPKPPGRPKGVQTTDTELTTVVRGTLALLKELGGARVTERADALIRKLNNI